MAKCLRCGAEFGGTSAWVGVLCPMCRLLEQQREAERRHVAEERERERERERAEEERREREEERLKLLKEQIRQDKARANEERAQSEDEHRRAKEAKADADAASLFRNSRPHCKWCGAAYAFTNGLGFGEYCSRKCAAADPTIAGKIADYGEKNDEVLAGKVREQLVQSHPVTAAIYAVGMKDIPFELLSELVGELEKFDLRRGDIDVLYRELDVRLERAKARAAQRRLEEEEARIRREREENERLQAEAAEKKLREEEKEKRRQAEAAEKKRREEEERKRLEIERIEALTPKCKKCGKPIAFDAADGVGEYCSLRCAAEALGAENLDRYYRERNDVVVRKAREALDGDCPVAAMLWARCASGLPADLSEKLFCSLNALDDPLVDRDFVRKLFRFAIGGGSVESIRYYLASRRMKDKDCREYRKLLFDLFPFRVTPENLAPIVETVNTREKLEALQLMKELFPEMREALQDVTAQLATRIIEKVYINCPFCGESMKIDKSWVGQTGECPYCGKGFMIDPKVFG